MDNDLAFGLTFTDLDDRPGLEKLDLLFLDQLVEQDQGLHARLMAARAAPPAMAEESKLITELGPYLDSFVATLFGIEAEISALSARTHALDPIHACKRLFVQRQAVKKYADPAALDGAAIGAALQARLGAPISDSSFAGGVAVFQAAEDAEALDLAMRYAAWATLTEPGRAAHSGSTLIPSIWSRWKPSSATA
jgi:hypothetical protein